jgi:cytochrome b6-f complex iron-sulfur subunit
MSDPDVSRRDFLKLARNGLLWLSAVLGFGGLLRFLDYEPNPAPKTEFDLGPATNYPLNSRTLLTEVPALLIHTESGFSTLSLTCTHLGCTVEKNKEGFVCPCHGSVFDADGKLLHGPAAKPLAPLRIETLEDGRLILHTE